MRRSRLLLPEGQGQLIAGVGYTEGSRRFEPSGQVVAAPTVRKLEAGGYLEYAPLGSKRITRNMAYVREKR